MSESGNEIEVEEQMADYQHEDLQGEVHRMVDLSETEFEGNKRS